MTTYLGGRRRLHPDVQGVDVTLANDLIALGGVSIGNDDNPLPGQLKGGISGGAFYVTGYDGAYLPVHVDGSELLFDISGSEALKLLSTGHFRIKNNKLFKSLNAAGNADLDLIGYNSSNGLVIGSGLTGVLKAVSSVISAATIVNADVSASAAIDHSKLSVPIYTATVAGAQSVANNAWATSTSTGLTIAVAGTYLFWANVQWAGAASGDCAVAFTLNGAAESHKTFSKLDNTDPWRTGLGIASFTASQTLNIRLFQNSGGALNCSNRTITAVRVA